MTKDISEPSLCELEWYQMYHRPECDLVNDCADCSLEYICFPEISIDNIDYGKHFSKDSR